jgi:hypothetical protein
MMNSDSSPIPHPPKYMGELFKRWNDSVLKYLQLVSNRHNNRKDEDIQYHTVYDYEFYYNRRLVFTKKN